MRFKLMVFCMLLTSHLLADSGEKVLNGYDGRVDVISENYEAGPFLIYDCIEKHYTCVLEEYYKECGEKRAKDVHERKEMLSCAPISEHLNKKSCFQKQLFIVSQNHGTRFCVGEEWKQKLIEF
jgi:hypothetical protein